MDVGFGDAKCYILVWLSISSERRVEDQSVVVPHHAGGDDHITLHGNGGKLATSRYYQTNRCLSPTRYEVRGWPGGAGVASTPLGKKRALFDASGLTPVSVSLLSLADAWSTR
jgi:hypothetical protein